MSDPQTNYTLPSGHDSSGTKIAILFGLVLALIAGNVYLFLQIDGLKKEMAKSSEAFQEEVSRVRETSTVTSAAARRNLEAIKSELDEARRQASAAVGQAKVDATKHAEELARKLEQQQKATEQAVRSEISKVEQTAATKIEDVNKEVSTVKTDVASAKTEIDKQIENLKSVRAISVCRAASSPPTERNSRPSRPSANATTSSSI